MRGSEVGRIRGIGCTFAHPRLRVFARYVVVALLCASAARAELVLVPAREMSGVERWREGKTWGAGNYFVSDGSPLTKEVALQGGAYEVYVRLFTSHATPADIRIWLNDTCLIPPMQAKVTKFGWLRVASVVLPAGAARLRVESPTPGQPSEHNIAAVALASDPMDDRVGRIISFTEWLRVTLARLEVAPTAPRSVAEARERQQAFRLELVRALGLDPLPPRTPLNPTVTGRIEKGDYVIEKVAYESRPDHVVPALLYLPSNASGPVPAVISAIGHWSYGKSSRAPQLRGIGLAKQGYAVLALDPVYAWERGIPGNSEGFEPFVAGACIAGHEVWDIMRGADYLESRPDIDASKLAVTGASGGGLQAFYAGAVDDRFDAVMPAVALWPMSELAVNFYYSGDNWVPGISRLGGMGNLIALTAPRAMLVMNVDADYATSYACEQLVNGARPFYRLLGAEARLFHTIEPGVHDYTRRMREDTYAFLDRWVKGSGDGLPVEEAAIETELFDEEDPALFVFEGGKIPRDNAETVQSIWVAEAAALRAQLPEYLVGLPDRIRSLLNMPPLGEPEVTETDRGYLVTTEPGLQVPVFRLGSGSRAVIWLGEDDFDSESQRLEVQALARHATVFIVEPRGAGMAGEMHILRHAPIVLGRPLTGMWAYDLLSVVDVIAGKTEFESVHVAGRGREAGLACLLAALLDERIDSAAIDRLFSSFVQLVGHGNPAAQLPGILKVADVEHLVRAAGAGRIHLNNVEPSDWAGGLPAASIPKSEFFREWIKAE
jgi:hypothetical protein